MDLREGRAELPAEAHQAGEQWEQASYQQQGHAGMFCVRVSTVLTEPVLNHQCFEFGTALTKTTLYLNHLLSDENIVKYIKYLPSSIGGYRSSPEGL